MVAAVRVHKHGGPEVLTFEDIEVPAPGQGQIKIKQYACGVNYIDTYFRMGMYPSPVGMPFVSGNEGAGEVIAVGPGVTDVKVGDRVERGATLLILEAMKMELPVKSETAGVIEAVNCQEGELVQPGAALIEIEEADEA